MRGVLRAAPPRARPAAGRAGRRPAPRDGRRHVLADRSAPPRDEAADEAAAGGEGAETSRAAGGARDHVVFVTAEVAPWSKTGGLGDVCAALPQALASRRSHRVTVVAPRYEPYADAWDTGIACAVEFGGTQHAVRFYTTERNGVAYVFVSHPALERGGIYGDAPGQPYPDNQFRFALLALSALEVPRRLPARCARVAGERCVFVANDWHAALVPVFLAARFQKNGQYLDARALTIVHNLAHVGVFDTSTFGSLGLDEEWQRAFEWIWPDGGSSLSLLKAGIGASERVVMVSPNYRREVMTRAHGCGMDAFLRDFSGFGGVRLKGIVNGIDTEAWDPSSDPMIPAHYDASNLAGKATCKAKLQEEMGLEVNPDVPLFGFIGRLDNQKGVDLMLEVVPWLIEEQGAQIIALGSGDPALEHGLREMETRFKGRAVGWVGFSVPVSHRITAGADMLLMPSRFEPCGLNQLYALRYGTLPVAHRTGGLTDTVTRDVGWTFSSHSAKALMKQLERALVKYRRGRGFREMQVRAMHKELGWDKAAEEYEKVLRKVVDSPDVGFGDKTLRRARKLERRDSRSSTARNLWIDGALSFWA